MRRVLRCDGVVPQYELDGRDPSPDDLVQLRAWLSEQAPGRHFDLIADGETIVEDIDCIDTSFPTFFELLKTIGAKFQTF